MVPQAVARWPPCNRAPVHQLHQLSGLSDLGGECRRRITHLGLATTVRISRIMTKDRDYLVQRLNEVELRLRKLNADVEAERRAGESSSLAGVSAFATFGIGGLLPILAHFDHLHRSDYGHLAHAGPEAAMLVLVAFSVIPLIG